VTGREKVLFDTEVNPDRIPVLTSAPLELILIESMPDVCSEHGLPSVGSRSFTVRSNGPGSEMPTARTFLRSMRWPWQPRESRGPDALLRFECPACDYCSYEVRRFRRISLLALLAVALTFAAIVVARLLGIEQLYVPLGFAVVPGCFPIALAVAVVSWTRSGYFADVWLTDTTDQLIVSAHPDFVTAVELRRAESH
jgi:hypothetical protein